jgi:hypothetical protein
MAAGSRLRWSTVVSTGVVVETSNVRWVELPVVLVGVAGITLLAHGAWRVGGALTGVWVVFSAGVVAQRWRSRSLVADPMRPPVLFSASREPVGDFRGVGYRKLRVIPVVVIAVVAVVASLTLVWLAATDPAHTGIEDLVVVVFSVAGLMSLRGLFLFSRGVLPGRTGLILDHDGLFDATRLDRPGYRRIAWNEIAVAHWVSGTQRLDRMGCPAPRS